jgi:exopolysaccharide biosynthesis polyprenyl glycosylphosphotransferase
MVKGRSTTPYAPLAAIEGLIALGIALASVVYGNHARMPTGGLHRFLEMRITLLNVAFAGVFMLAWIYCFHTLSFRAEPDGALTRLKQIVKGCTVMAGLLILCLIVARTQGPAFRIGVIFFVGSLFYEICRLAFGVWIGSRDPQLVIILGSGRRAGKAWREVRIRYRSSVKLLGFVDDRAVSDMAPDVAARYLGTIDDLPGLLLDNVVDELLIALPMKSCYEKAQNAIAIAQPMGVQVVCMQDMYVSSIKGPDHLDQALFSELVPFPERYLAEQSVKRFVDVIVSLIGLLIFTPVFLVIAILIKGTGGGPVFFSQERFGRRRRLFRMYKFSTPLRDEAELMAQQESRTNSGHLPSNTPRESRVTPLGHFLRASSLDELPQLLNVLMGNMSLVGPRPMSTRDILRYSGAALMRRFTVKPGITGLWQVSGRGALTSEKRIEMDSEYIDHWSLTLDWQILARTIRAVLNREGAA